MVKVLIECIVVEGLEFNYEQIIVELLGYVEKLFGYLGGEFYCDVM